MMYNLVGLKEVRMLPLFLVLMPVWCHFHWVPKLKYFAEHNMGYQPSKFQCFRLSLSNWTEWGRKHLPSAAARPKSQVLIGLRLLNEEKVGIDEQQMQNLGCTKFL